MAKLITPFEDIDLNPEDFQESKSIVEESHCVTERGIWFLFYKEIRHNKKAMICMMILFVVVFASLMAPLSPYDPDSIDVSQVFASPSTSHWFGSDELGRDSFTRILYGGRVSLAVGIASMIVSVGVGIIVGVVSGYLGGKIDSVCMRIVDIMQSVPSLLMIIVLFSFIPNNMMTLVIMLSLFSWTNVARIVRAETLTLKERDFVIIAETMGVSKVCIICRHVIPNMLSQIIVAASLSIAGAILDESALSFLGYGVALPQASWGSMLQNAQQYILYKPLLAFIPGAFILVTVLCLNVLGDTLQHTLNPHLRMK